MTKKMVARTTDAYVNFDGDTLISVAEQIKELIETYSGTAYLDYRMEDSRMEDYSEGYVYKLMTKSEETDDEYADRLSEEESSVDWRKREYEVLKKEFGGDN